MTHAQPSPLPHGRPFWRPAPPRLPSTPLLLESAVLALALAGFLLLGRLYTLAPVAAADAATLRAIGALRSRELDQVARTVTAFGSEWLWMVWVPVVLVLLAKRRYPDAVAVAVVALGVSPLNDTLKELYQRARPIEHGSGAQAYSFPSGHAMASGAVYTMLAILAWRDLRGRARVAGMVAAIGAALLIALTRPYLGVHYPSDVLAGLLAGALWADLVVLTWRTGAHVVRARAAPVAGG